MSKKNDGGPAFSRAAGEYHGEDGRVYFARGQDGMSLRDWFAGQALSGILSSTDNESGRSAFTTTPAWIAEKAYEQADAMLEARKK